MRSAAASGRYLPTFAHGDGVRMQTRPAVRACWRTQTYRAIGAVRDCEGTSEERVRGTGPSDSARNDAMTNEARYDAIAA
jgi:hypothetical protein